MWINEQNSVWTQARFAGIGPEPAQCATRTSTALKALLPEGVAAAELSGPVDPNLLCKNESLLLERAVPKRAREFAAGRLCARHAARHLGIGQASLDVRADRRPQWPDGFTGSITHTDDYCAAAVAERWRIRAIGIDAEISGRVTPDLWGYLFLPLEIRWLESLPAAQQAHAATLMFSAKEAFYKCQYEVTQQWLEFQDVVLELCRGSTQQGSFLVRPVGSVELFEQLADAAIVHFLSADGRVLSAMSIANTQALSQ